MATTAVPNTPGAATHEAQVAAMFARQEFENHARLAMLAGGDDNSPVGPFHALFYQTRAMLTTNLSVVIARPLDAPGSIAKMLATGKAKAGIVSP